MLDFPSKTQMNTSATATDIDSTQPPKQQRRQRNGVTWERRKKLEEECHTVVAALRGRRPSGVDIKDRRVTEMAQELFDVEKAQATVHNTQELGFYKDYDREDYRLYKLPPPGLYTDDDLDKLGVLTDEQRDGTRERLGKLQEQMRVLRESRSKLDDQARKEEEYQAEKERYAAQRRAGCAPN